MWAMPNMFGSPCHLARNTRPSCVRSWYTVWLGRRCGGCLYCFVCLAGRHFNCRNQGAQQRLQRVGFVISQKSVTEQADDLHFVGKVFDLKRGTLENRPGMLRGLVRLWLLLVLGLLNRKGMERLLGRLEWALRPSVGLSPFLAGAYCWKHAGGSRVPRALLRPLLTAICFAFVPQKYPVKARVQVEPPTYWGDHVLFADAAAVGPDNFSVCLYLPLGGMRTFRCPR